MTTPTAEQVEAAIAALTPMGRAFMLQVGQGGFDFFDQGIVENSGNYSANMAWQFRGGNSPRSSGGVMARLLAQPEPLWRVMPDASYVPGFPSDWWDLTALGAAVANKLAADAAELTPEPEPEPRPNQKERTMSYIRDVRESKNLSQTAVADACGLTFSRYERIETGSPRTTQEEIDSVLKVLNAMPASEKKLVGRPFSDPKKQAAVEAARQAGKSVFAVIHDLPEAEAPKPRRTRKAQPKPEPEPTPEPKPTTRRARAKKS